MKSYILFFLVIFQWSVAQNDSIFNIGKKLINENKLEEAITYFNKNLKTTKNQEQKTYILLGLADAYKLKLNYNLSNNYYLKAYSIIKTLNNKQLYFLYHVKMAEFYRKRTLFKEAVKELNSADKLLNFNKISDRDVAQFYSRKAALFSEYFRIPDSTLFYANKALKFSKKAKYKDGVFSATLEISGVLEELKEYKKAIRYIEYLIDYSNENRLVQQKVDAQINYTRLLIKDNQLEKALSECFIALEFAKKNNIFFGQMIFTDNIRNIYKELGNIEKAYEFSIIRTELTEKYYKYEHDKFLFELEEKYKLSEKDKQIKINNLEIKNKNKELITTRAKFLLISGLFVLAILGTLLIAFFLNKTKQNNKKLLFLSKQNEFLVSETNHRVNNNLQLISLLIENRIRKNKSESEKTEFTRLLSKVEAIAALHRHLYVTNNVSTINLQEYLMDIKNNFEELTLEESINLTATIEEVKIDSDTALYLGLLITELYINSIKYAFNSQQEKNISFSVIKKNNVLVFTYVDNGENSKNKIIKPVLAEQLCLQLEVEPTINTDNGFHFSFTKNHSQNA